MLNVFLIVQIGIQAVAFIILAVRKVILGIKGRQSLTVPGNKKTACRQDVHIYSF